MEFLFGLDMLRKHQVLYLLFQDLLVPFFFFDNSTCSFHLLCYNSMPLVYILTWPRLQFIIDLKENVLRVGGGEVSVPFLQGSFELLFN